MTICVPLRNFSLLILTKKQTFIFTNYSTACDNFLITFIDYFCFKSKFSGTFFNNLLYFTLQKKFGHRHKYFYANFLKFYRYFQ